MKTRFCFILLIVLVISSAAIGCPLCKDAIGSTDAQSAGTVAAGFNDSIYMMFAAFCATIGWMIYTIVKGARTAPGAQHRAFPSDKSK